MELLELFKDYKYQSLSVKDRYGENPLFECARNGNEKIFNWFIGSNEFFKARGQQNYKGQTIEHIVCLHKQFELVEEIRPRLDSVDYYGSLPLFYSLQQDDVKMIEKYFSDRPKECFKLRNYKWETIFHIAAKTNSLDSLKLICGRTVFISQLLKKDYAGNTAIHIAAKSGSLEVLTFLCKFVTKGFLEIQNDFGFTPFEAAKEKFRLMEVASQSKEKDRDLEEGEVVQLTKMDRVESAAKLLFRYDDYITEERWNQHFDLSFEMFLS